MNLAIASTSILLTLLLLVSKGSTQTQELLGQQLRLTGQWSEDRFKATRVRLWDTVAVARGRGDGGGHGLEDAGIRLVRTGPILAVGNDATALGGFAIAGETSGRGIEE